jgi:hypothetical protein
MESSRLPHNSADPVPVGCRFGCARLPTRWRCTASSRGRVAAARNHVPPVPRDGMTRPAVERFRVYRPTETSGLGISGPDRCPRETVTGTCPEGGAAHTPPSIHVFLSVRSIGAPVPAAERLSDVAQQPRIPETSGDKDDLHPSPCHFLSRVFQRQRVRRAKCRSVSPPLVFREKGLQSPALLGRLRLRSGIRMGWA